MSLDHGEQEPRLANVRTGLAAPFRNTVRAPTSFRHGAGYKWYAR